MENDKRLQTRSETHQEQAGEVSLSQVIDFLISIRKPLGLGMVGGLALGLAGAMVLGAYKSEMILDNSNKVIDFSSWRVFESRLPAVAARALERKLVKDEDIEHYKKLAQTERTAGGSWLKKNVSPTFSLSKSDFKNFAAMSKEAQDAAGVLILNLAVTNSDGSRQNSEKNLQLSADFIQTGSAYLQLKSLLDGYGANISNTEAAIQGKMSATEVEITVAQQKAQNFEKLKLRFPTNGNLASSQVNVGFSNDSKDSLIKDPIAKDPVAKYLPISTQLVAANIDLNNLNADMVRMVDQLAQQKTMRVFLNLVMPLLADSLDGVQLVERMLVVEADMRKTFDPKNTKQLNTMDGIHTDLVAIRTRFGTFMERSDITTTRSGLVIPGLLGGMAGGFLTLLLLLGQRLWLGLKVKPGAPSAA